MTLMRLSSWLLRSILAFSVLALVVTARVGAQTWSEACEHYEGVSSISSFNLSAWVNEAWYVQGGARFMPVESPAFEAFDSQTQALRATEFNSFDENADGLLNLTEVEPLFDESLVDMDLLDEVLTEADLNQDKMINSSEYWQSISPFIWFSEPDQYGFYGDSYCNVLQFDLVSETEINITSDSIVTNGTAVGESAGKVWIRGLVESADKASEMRVGGGGDQYGLVDDQPLSSYMDQWIIYVGPENTTTTYDYAILYTNVVDLPSGDCGLEDVMPWDTVNSSEEDMTSLLPCVCQPSLTLLTRDPNPGDDILKQLRSKAKEFGFHPWSTNQQEFGCNLLQN